MRVQTKALSLALAVLAAVLMASCSAATSSPEKPSTSTPARGGGEDALQNAERGEPSFLAETLAFYETAGFLQPDSGKQIGWWAEINLFGWVEGEFGELSGDEVAEKLAGLYPVEAVTTREGGGCPVGSARWMITGGDEKRLEFRLGLLCDGLAGKQATVTAVTIGGRSYPVGEYAVVPVDCAEPGSGFVYENALDLLDTAARDMTLTYLVAIPAAHRQDDLGFSVRMAENPAAEALEVADWEYNEAATEELRQSYETIKTPRELQDLRVYTVNLRVVTLAGDAVLQPAITIASGGREYRCYTDPIHYSIQEPR